MPIKTLKFAASSLVAVAIILTPLVSRADEAGTNAPASPGNTDAPLKKKGTPFAGDLMAVDTNAMTLTVTNLTLSVTSATVIKHGSKPATLADAVALIGKHTTGSYKKGVDGKLEALTVHLNSKAGSKKGPRKKKEADPSAAN
jgi:hypothetical protein